MRKSFRILPIAAALLLTACAYTGPVSDRSKETVFYPPLPQEPRVQFLTTITREIDLGRKPGPFGAGLDYNKLDRPVSMASEKGKLYVVDRAYQKIIVADFNEASLEPFPDRREGALLDPVAIRITEDGYKYIGDRGRGQVLVYDQNNEYVRPYGERGQFQDMTDIAVSQDRIYVCESRDHRIVVLDRNSGEVLYTIGARDPETGESHPGVGAGEFNQPTHIAVTSKGELLVVDAMNLRMMFFGPDGKFIQQMGGGYAGPGGLVRPRGVAISRDGLAYLADAGLEFVQVFDVGKGVTERGLALMHFGKIGSGRGETVLTTSVHVDHDNLDAFAKYVDRDFKLEYLIFVGSQRADHAVSVYGFGHWIGGKL